jgi:gpW.
MADTLEQLQTKLQLAQDAFFKLTTGGLARVMQDQNGERIEYSAGNLSALRNLILSLQWQIAQLGGPAVSLGPMGIIA